MTNFDNFILHHRPVAYDSDSAIDTLISGLKSTEHGKLLEAIKNLERLYQQKYVSVA